MADLDLTGVTLEATKIKLTGSFDGQGHTIKNANYESAASKTGILVAQLNGGTVKNVRFMSCSVNSTNESPAIVAGEMNNGGSVINVEFNNCSVSTTGSYGGIVYARSEGGNATGKEVLLDQITIKNNSFVSCGQYGGLVTGDNVSSVKLTNSHIIGQLKKSSNNYGLLLGRTRNNDQKYTVENVVADVVYDGTIGTSTGFICQGKNACAVEAKNLVVIDANTSIAGANGVLSAENVYYSSDASVKSTGTGINEVPSSSITSEWIKTVLSDFDTYWVIEDETHIKLKDATANVVGENDVLSNIVLYITNIKTRFKKGEAFNSNGLSVVGHYESGIDAPIKAENIEVISSSFNANEVGEYEISVKVKETSITATYKVKVVAQTGFEINDEFVKHAYIVGETFDASNLVARSTWNDGKIETMDVSSLTIDSSNFDNTQEGTYNIVVKCDGFEDKEFVVEVSSTIVPTPVNNVVTFAVDDDFNGINGGIVNEVPTFNSVTKALEFIKASNYQSSVKKVINIKDGTYREKITLSIDNVIFNGESQEGTKIVYNAVESTVNPVTNSKYGMNCATLHVNAQGFEAHNITIANDFDYKNNQYNAEFANVKEAEPQGIALTLNGDKFVIENCIVTGNQDTIYLKAGRTYFKGGKIEGNIDFICGEAKGIAFFDEVNIHAKAKALTAAQMKNNGYVTAMKGKTGSVPAYGLVFNSCGFTAEDDVPAGSMSLARPWEKEATVSFINCSFTKAYATSGYDGKNKARWESMSGNSPVNAHFSEFGSTGEGAITEAVAGGSILTPEQAATYTMENVFAATNGDFSFPTAFNPLSSEEEQDENIYYYFNGSSSSTGHSYTYDLHLNGTTNEDWNGLSIDATLGKVDARTSDAQINKGAKIKFTVPAKSLVSVETYPGYPFYTLNGTATYKDQYNVYYANETEVTFEATSTMYLLSIIIKPNQEAPVEAVTSKEVKIVGMPDGDIEVGKDLDFSKVVVQDYLSDGTLLTLTKDVDYTIDTSNVNKDVAGTYPVTVVYGNYTKTFNVKYVSNYDPRINKSVTYSFKDDVSNASEDYIVYDNSAFSETSTLGKLTFELGGGLIKDNGDWIVFQQGAMIKFSLAKEAKLNLSFYNDLMNVEVKVNDTVVTIGEDKSFTLPAGDVVITSKSFDHSEYIGKIIITIAE